MLKAEQDGSCRWCLDEQNAVGNMDADVVFMRLKMEIRLVLGTGLQALHATILVKNLVMFFPYPENESETEFKYNRINLFLRKL